MHLHPRKKKVEEENETKKEGLKVIRSFVCLKVVISEFPIKHAIHPRATNKNLRLKLNVHFSIPTTFIKSLSDFEFKMKPKVQVRRRCDIRCAAGEL